MQTTKPMSWLKLILVLSLVCSFSLTATAQDYYPTTIGNTWVFLSQDGAERRTYSIEESDVETDKEAGIFILKIVTETLGTETVDTDIYYISDDNGDLKLHRTKLDEGAFGIAAAMLDPSALFFPADLPLGRTWDIVTVTELDLVGTATTTSTIEVEKIEDVETPAGTFKNCVKLKIERRIVTALVTLRPILYQWLAPDVGPVKYQNDQDIVYELESYNLIEETPAVETPAEPETPEEPAVETPAEPETPEEPAVVTPEVIPTPPDLPPIIGEHMFEITLTNLTTGEPGKGGQIFSSPIFATHFKADSLAPVGQPAAPALVALAENGDVSGILEIATSIAANTVVADNVVVPGGSVTVRLNGNVLNATLTVASMLVSTNDGFIAASGVPLFDETGMPVSTTLELMAYDAGSEDNTELASDIPGPLGLDAEADPEGSNARVPTEGGVITAHPGIQGVGDVSEAFAWTEPTATLTITPVSDEEMPEPIKPSSFDVALESGLNMISIPLMPAEPYTAKSLAMMLGASVVIKLDAATQHLVGYSYAEEGDGFDIDGSSGYIVNTPAGGVFTFTGTAWQNKSDDAAAAPKVSTAKDAWAFVITSALQDKENGATYTVVAKNLRTGVVATEKVANEKASVSAVWANMNRKSVIQVGDKLEIALLDKRGTIVSGPFQRTVTTSDIHNAYLSVQMRVGDVRPKETILGQNFPNPFNPETWIPYQLSRDSNVTVQIYNVSGSAVRTLNLGHKSIGSYITTSTAAYWDGKNSAGEHVSSGIYFYTLQTDKFSATRRMVILK